MQGETSLDICNISPPIINIIEGNSSAVLSGNKMESDKCLTTSLYKEEIELNSMHSIEQIDRHQAEV